MARKQPSRQEARESFNKSEAPRRMAAEKDERVVADTNLATKDASHDTSLTNVQNTNAAQNTSIGDLGGRMGNAETLNANQNTTLVDLAQKVGSLETRMTNQESVNTAQQANIVDLVNFRDRAAGFATAGHVHDERYYGKGQSDAWFMHHATHPQGYQKHGNGYHDPLFQPA